jgi:hypothetical protein
MASWVLNCPDCDFDFLHSTIRKSSLGDFYLEPKPEFPPEGRELECPNCGKKATYKRINLSYRA